MADRLDIDSVPVPGSVEAVFSWAQVAGLLAHVTQEPGDDPVFRVEVGRFSATSNDLNDAIRLVYRAYLRTAEGREARRSMIAELETSPQPRRHPNA